VFFQKSCVVLWINRV